MCGICGIVDPRGVAREDVQRMTDVLAHRGPDDQGVIVEQGFGFGHRRLSIIDLSGGKQPMANDDRTVWITFNGEIYNFPELRKELESKYRFRTDSDTEVLLHLYEESGENCVSRLRGMFAFAVYDARNRTLFAARDHLGQKPLYYHHAGERFAFASEIKALLELEPRLREMDCEALSEYFTLRIIAPPRSMFRRIRKLPPGHFLRFADGEISIERYWRLRFEPKTRGGFNDILEELEGRVSSTVRHHLISDVPVGAFLSGGMDSSLVVAFMSQHGSARFKTFSGDVPYREYSELPHAELISKKYDTLHHTTTITPELTRTLPRVVWHLDEPSDPLSLCMYYISKLARSHVKVVLGGDGGDELFGGYDRYFGNIYATYYALLPGFVRKRLLGPLIRLMPEGSWYRSLGHKLRWMQQLSCFKDGERYAKSLSYFYFSDRFRKSLFTEKFIEAAGSFDPEMSLKENCDSASARRAIDRMLHADSMIRLPDHPVMILDRMTMAHGLEARSPFLDHELAEFCARIPPRHKVRFRRLRFIQVQLARRHLPAEVINKKKQGFSSALTYLLKEEFKRLYRTFLLDSRLVQDGYLRLPAIDELLNQHLAEKVDHGNRLWLLCSAEIWYRMFIHGQSIDEISSDMAAAPSAPSSVASIS